MSVSFEAVETGTRITVVRSGFGEGDDFEIFRESHPLGWHESMRDLAVYLRTGYRARRHLVERSAFGLKVRSCEAGLAVTDGGRFDLLPGDLLISVNGAAIYDRSDLWLLTRLLEPGAQVELGFVRDGAPSSCRGTMSSVDGAVVGELGLGPREERVASV